MSCRNMINADVISNQLLLGRQRKLIYGMKASDVLMGVLIHVSKLAIFHYQGTV